MDNLKTIIKAALKEERLKYNYFNSQHPNQWLKGKLFKFLENNKIKLLNDNKEVEITPQDLELNGQKLYTPADGF